MVRSVSSRGPRRQAQSGSQQQRVRRETEQQQAREGHEDQADRVGIDSTTDPPSRIRPPIANAAPARVGVDHSYRSITRVIHRKHSQVGMSYTHVIPQLGDNRCMIRCVPVDNVMRRWFV